MSDDLFWTVRFEPFEVQALEAGPRIFSAVMVVAFFGFGLLYGRGTHLTLADYWRWFVVHLWVESIFEFFGVGVIALLLFSWRGMIRKEHWNDRILKVSFFGLNVGLLLMTLGTLFPVGIIQAWTSYQEGLWAARDAGFFQGEAVAVLGQIRMIADTIIIVLGVLPLFYFLFRTFPKLKAKGIEEGESVWDKIGVQL